MMMRIKRGTMTGMIVMISDDKKTAFILVEITIGTSQQNLL